MLHLERRSSPSTTWPIAAFMIALVMCLAFVLSMVDVDNNSVDPGSVRPMAAPVGLDQ